MEIIREQIDTNQSIIFKIFKVGKRVTPLMHYIPGTTSNSYEYSLLWNMLNAPAKIIEYVDMRENRIKLVNSTLYWSPAMFQEFWIYALFKEEFAKQILETLETGIIDKILNYAFTCHSSGINPFLQRIANGKVMDFLSLSVAFAFSDTIEGFSYWQTVNESLLDRVLKERIKVKRKENKTDIELPLIIIDKHNRLTVMDFKIKTPIINK